MRWTGARLAVAAALLGVGVAACQPVTPPPPPPPLPAPTAANWTSDTLQGVIQAQPQYVPAAALTSPSPQETADGGVVVVATEADDVYGLDPKTGQTLWGPISIGTAEPLAENDAYGPLQTLPGCGDIDPLGITSNPVVDGGFVWVVGEREANPGGSAPHQPEHVIAGIDPATGAFHLNPTNIDPSAMSVATAGSTQNEVSAEQQRTGLVARNGHVYVGFGGLAGDCGPYHGFVVNVNESDGSIGGYFESATSPATPNDREGAVWAPGGMAIDPADSTLYPATGNSQDITTPITPANQDYSDAVVQLPLGLGPNVTPTSVFQPSTFATDNFDDLDLGSSAPMVVVPQGGVTDIFEIGKRGAGYLLNESNLALLSQAQICNGGVFGSTATEGNLIFVPCRGSVMQQYLVEGTPSSLVPGWTSPSNVTAGGPAVVDPVTNLVFSADTGSDQLFAVSPTTGLAVARYPLGLAPPEHFPMPEIGDGQVFIESNTTVKAFTS